MAQQLKIWYCGRGSIPDLGTSTCCRPDQKKKKKKKKEKEKKAEEEEEEEKIVNQKQFVSQGI